MEESQFTSLWRLGNRILLKDQALWNIIAMMKYAYYDTDDPIAALATPWGESALAVIRVSGKGAIELTAPCFSHPEVLLGGRSHTIHYMRFIDPADGSEIDEVTAALYRAPHGYTGQDSLEIFCHGSLVSIRKILEALKASGFRDARPGEFTLRAFMHGKLDLTQAEAVQEIVSAKSSQAHSLALHRLSGGLFRQIDSVKQELLTILGRIELQLDYAEDEVVLDEEIDTEAMGRMKEALEALSATYRTGRIFSEGVRVTLAGPTNAGKSSLFNLFLKEDRSIVSDIHGTTRDYIESWISVRGVPVRLFDTAGFRESTDSIEEEGIRRSVRILEESDLVVYLIGEDEDVSSLMADHPEYIFVWNKSDIRGDLCPDGALRLCSLTGEGFASIEEQIISRLRIESFDTLAEHGIMIDSLRQKELLDRACESLGSAATAVADGMPLDVIAPDIQECMDALGEITGEVTTSDILDTIFSGFCVGK